MQSTRLAPVRDLPRLCRRCELQARRASTLSALRQRLVTTPAPAHLARTPLTKAFGLPAQPAAISAAPFTTTARCLDDDDNTNAHRRPSPPRTHYDLFPETLSQGPPPKGHFPIDTRTLRREFLQLQAKAHPDRHPSPADKKKAEALSALINEAYKTLSNPLLRAQYLLSLRGVDVAEDETLKVEEPDLLMLVLEAREEIEDAAAESDLDEPRRINDERIAESEIKLDQAFAQDDVESAKREAVRMRYWVNIKDSLDNWEKGKPVVLEH